VGGFGGLPGWAGLVGQQQTEQHLQLRKYPAGGRPSTTDYGLWTRDDGLRTPDSTLHSSHQVPCPLAWKKVQSKCTTQSLPGAASGELVNGAGGRGMRQTRAAATAGAAKRATHQPHHLPTSQAVVAQIRLTQSLIKSHDRKGRGR